MQPVIGMDVGGTASRIVVMRDEHVIAAETISTPHHADAVAALIEGIRAALETAAVDAADLRGIGVGASGPVDADGTIRNPATLPALSGIPLAGLLGDAFDTTALIDNDAVTAALAEWQASPITAPSGLLMVTLGTGVGVAVIREGRPFRGADGVHPEGGHLTVPGAPAACYCGRETCLEQAASRTALQTAAKNATGTEDLGALSRSAERGEDVARTVFDDYGTRVGDGLLELCTQHRPSLVVLGGSASTHLRWFRKGLDARLRTLTDAGIPDVRSSGLGDLGGAIGAAHLVGAVT
ncbi:glucokinase [Rathayibacter sp. AY2B7]|uniref:ROK family protein n=1 Tax=Rathayibacter sp. AY2B7 TaxID=2080571 RepID=UPI000CE7AAEC|nr:ROK family protein [Rathayibacter sp. AY2B7]PPG63958.1 glucokinase [Rathayibacter sp. AY2B7]